MTRLDEYQQRVPAIVRTVFYWAAATSGILGALAVSLTAALAPAHVGLVSEIVAPIVTAIASITGILGVVYRPTHHTDTPA